MRRLKCREAWLAALLVATAIFSFARAIYGGVVAFSPVPFWDMWEGVMGFYLRLAEGDLSVWWAQHNEHRIVLARLIFLADFRLCGGGGQCLIMANYLVHALGVGLFVWLGWRITKARSSDDRWITLAVIVALSYLWTQSENFTWGFQSQFFMAQVLPLLTFVLAALFNARRGAAWLFWAAVVAGAGSVLSMASGVIVLPMLCGLAAWFRWPWPRVLVVVFVTLAAVIAYFADFHRPSGHGGVLHSFLNLPLESAGYFLMYLGSPFHFLVGQGHFGAVVAAGAGGLMIAWLATVTWQLRRTLAWSVEETALFAMLTYLLLQAVATAGGRVVFGMEQALASRYTTPAVMAWCCVFLLHMAVRPVGNRLSRAFVPAGLLLVLALTVLSYQLRATRTPYQLLSDRDLAGLAALMNVSDAPAIRAVYHTPDRVAGYVADVSRLGVGPFVQAPWVEWPELMTQIDTPSAMAVCLGAIDRLTPIEGQTRFTRIEGWLFDGEAKASPRRVLVLDEHDRVVGHALTGNPRMDVKDAVGRKALKSGFRGYVLSEATRKLLTLQGQSHACRWRAE